MCRMHTVFLGLVAGAAFYAAGPSAGATDRPAASSGKTQVVAKLDKREITIADLRSEMARLGLSPNDPEAEPAALQSIINRALLSDAARQAGFHRQPEALRQMATAQEQALADIYLASASQPAEPTRAEIEDFVTENPSIFSTRRIYTFSVMTLATEAFDASDLTPLFNESADFDALGEALDRAGLTYSLTPAVQPSDAFPEAIRRQLADYGVRDNVVIRGQTSTQIMKITAIRQAPVRGADAPAIARRMLMAQGAQKRAGGMLENLRQRAAVSYYRQSAAPQPGLELEPGSKSGRER